MKCLQLTGIFVMLATMGLDAVPKLTYVQRHDERAPFIYVTVHNDNGTTVTYTRNRIAYDSGDGVTTLKKEASKNDDLVVFPTGSKLWNWHAHMPHTSHRPGILPADVQELVENHKVDIVILSRGVENVLQVDPSTIDYLKKHNKQYYVLETRQAINKYNELVKLGKKVGGLFHTTC